MSKVTGVDKNNTTQVEGGKVLEFLDYMDKLKHLDRAGWLRHPQIPRPVESVASHMHRMSIMAAFLIDDESNPKLDMNKCIKMCLVHDLGESIIGDITPHDAIDDVTKNRIETEAIVKLAALLPSQKKGEELKQLFLEYEEGVTAEAKLVKQLDKLDMLVQAQQYEKKAATDGQSDGNRLFLQGFFDSTAPMFSNPLELNPQVRELYSKIIAARNPSN